MKNFYQDAEMEVVAFDAEDVISTSGGNSGGLVNGGVGSGDSADFGDLFPGLG